MTKTELKQALNKPLKSEQDLNTEQALKVLCSKILNIRTDYKNISFLIEQALKLALKDYVKHNNINSFKVLLTLKQDKKSVYNLPYVKNYLSFIGLDFSYNVLKDDFTIREYKDFNPEQALNSSFISFKQALQKEQAEQKKEQALKEHKEKEQALKEFLNKNGFKGSLEQALNLLK